MRVRIHRGAREIGGSCVELETEGSRLVLDLGLPLSAGWGDPPELPAISGLGAADSTLLGVVVSHAHPDHVGLIQGARDGLPFVIGAAAARILREAAFFGAAPVIPDPLAELSDGVSVKLGPFTLTPYLVDHSAYDAYSLLVEAAGRRLLYSGDLRSHGRKPGTFKRLLGRPPNAIDALLLEGTRLSRPDTTDDPSEADVERQLIELFSRADGLVLACYSPQNVDRYVGIYRAAVQSGRELVVDLYGASVAAATGNSAIPQAEWERVRVYVPHSQRRRVIKAKAFERIDAIKPSRIFLEELGANPGRFVLSFRASMAREIEALDLRGAQAVWSMWPGYLKREHTERMRRFLVANEIPLSVAHASGHARVADLRRLAHSVDPRYVVPIHTEVPDAYDRLHPRIECHGDGECWEL